MKKEIIAVDLFCGAGGLTRGLLDAGINVKKGYDFDSDAEKTYDYNNSGAKFYLKDICNLKGQEMISDLDLKNNYFLLAGCAPCQPFSSINKNSNKGDNRKNLLLEFGRLISETKPDFILMENVPGLKNNKGKYIFQQFLNILDKENYSYDFSILNVKNYGVPQKRTRLVLIASKLTKVTIPEPTHGILGKLPIVTLRQAISRFPPLSAGQKKLYIPNHECRGLDKINKERLKFIKKNGGSRTDLPPSLILKCHLNHGGHTDAYGRMCWEEVAPTLTCKCTSISNGRFGHPTQNRAISVREAAAIQTFPTNYTFFGNIGETTKMVGNAVPVIFAKVFGEYFIKLKKSVN